MEENRFIVYKHTNKTNGKVYIGQTCRKYLRDDGELRKARKTGKKYHGYYWQDLPKADIDKYKKYIN